MFLTSNHYSLYIVSLVEKVISSESGEKYTQIKHHLQIKLVHYSSIEKCKCVNFYVKGDNRDGVKLYRTAALQDRRHLPLH